MTTPSVSFLLPVRDAADTIAESIRSALAQTIPPLEVLVVDDGSADGSDAIARSIGDARVRVLTLPPSGIVAALNAGLAACRGRLIARLDADDRATPDRLARQLDALEGVTVVDGQVRFFRDEDEVPEGMRRYEAWINGVVTPADFDRELLIDSPVVHPAATFHADAVRRLGGYRDGPFPEDYDLWLRLHAAGHRFRKVPRVLVEMRDRPARLTRTDPRYGREGFRRVRQAWLRATALDRPRRVVLIGGGRASRPWLRWLLAEGHAVVAIVDVARRGARRGVPVVAPSALPGLEADLALATIGSRDAREPVRTLLAALRPDWREGRDWWLLS